MIVLERKMIEMTDDSLSKQLPFQMTALCGPFLE